MDVRIRFDRRILAVAALSLAWFVATGLLVSGQGGFGAIESRGTGRLARAGALGLLTGSSILFWIEHISLALLSLFAAFRRRADILLLLILGPAIAFACITLANRWLGASGPEGLTNAYSIVWLGSLAVTAEWWCLFQSPDSNRSRSNSRASA